MAMWFTGHLKQWMEQMKKTLFVLFLVVFLAENVMAEKKIQIGYFNAPPHIVYDYTTQRVSGAVYDFLTYDIGPLMDVTFIWEPFPSNMSRLMVMLEEGHLDAIALMAFTPERAQTFFYTIQPFVLTRSTIAVLNGSRLKMIENVEDLIPYTIGYTKNYFISPFMHDSRIHFDYVHSTNPNLQNLRKLKAGRIDCVYIPDKITFLAMLKDMNMENEVRLLELPEKPIGLYVVFAKEEKEYAKKYDNVFQTIHGDQVYLKRVSKYIDISRL